MRTGVEWGSRCCNINLLINLTVPYKCIMNLSVLQCASDCNNYCFISVSYLCRYIDEHF